MRPAGPEQLGALAVAGCNGRRGRTRPGPSDSRRVFEVFRGADPNRRIATPGKRPGPISMRFATDLDEGKPQALPSSPHPRNRSSSRPEVAPEGDGRPRGNPCRRRPGAGRGPDVRDRGGLHHPDRERHRDRHRPARQRRLHRCGSRAGGTAPHHGRYRRRRHDGDRAEHATGRPSSSTSHCPHAGKRARPRMLSRPRRQPDRRHARRRGAGHEGSAPRRRRAAAAPAVRSRERT